jgi:hypothetical protein
LPDRRNGRARDHQGLSPVRRGGPSGGVRSITGTGDMTERKPPGMRYEDWIERQIREAQERGAFDDLPGAGKPIPGLDRPFTAQAGVAA